MKFLKLTIYALVFLLSAVFFTAHASAATSVYYSVGQSVADLKTGTPTVTLVSGTATFSVAQTGNIGVGDRVTYGTNVVAYIESKTSTSVWKLVTATGGVPADITTSTVVSIKREYTSLAAAIAGASDVNHINNTDLTAAGVTLNIPCYYDSGADTTAVTVSGFTTGATNFIKIYTPFNTSTEANNSQRHQGKWDDAKYRLSRAASGDTGITITSNFTVVDGIQLEGWDGPWVFATGIKFNLYGGMSTISNNIIRNIGTSLTDRGGDGITIYEGNNSVMYGNIIYNIRRHGIIIWDYKGVNMYNNTIYNYQTVKGDGGNGINAGANSSGIVKNNLIIAGANDGIAFVPGAGMTVATNGTSDASGTSGMQNLSMGIEFADSISQDFHLKNTAASRGIGTNLSAIFSTDIDGQARTRWDIGADEAATAIYYSVGQNTNDHKTGTPTVDIASGTATFSVAQIATNMGVGDKVTYNTSSVTYISAKISTTQWKLVTATGAVPADVSAQTVNSISHTYASLSAAKTGAVDSNHLNTADLVTDNYQLNFPCYYDTGADTTSITASGYLTSPTNYVRIYTPNNVSMEVNQSQRHSGKWDDNKYTLRADNYFGVIQISNNDFKIEGLQIENTRSGTNTGNQAGIFMASNAAKRVDISNNIIRETGKSISSDDNAGIDFAQISGIQTLIRINNNIIYGFYRGIRYRVAGGTKINELILYNNTIKSNGIDFQLTSYSTNDILRMKNNIAQSSVSNYFFESTVETQDYANNLSVDATSPNAAFRSKTVVFADAINKNFHLSFTDTAAKKAGISLQNDPYLHFSSDIDGQERAGNWDIGADEFAEVVEQAQQSSPSLDAGLVGHWTFDGKDISGTTANDTSGNNNNGTISGATPTIGKLGQALSFNGSISQVSVPNSTSLNVPAGSNMTISSRVNPNNISNNPEIVRKGTAGVANNYYFEILSNGRIYYYGCTQSSSGINLNEWSNVAISKIGTSVTYYINGVSAGTYTCDNSGSASSEPFRIGSDSDTPSTSHFSGKLDDIRLYNRALSASEIEQLYHQGQVEIKKTGTTVIRK